MAKKTLDQCRSGKDFLNYADCHGAEIRNGKGSHAIVKVKGCSTQTVVPCHNDDLGTGLRVKIIKAFLVMGLGTILFVLFDAASKVLGG